MKVENENPLSNQKGQSFLEFIFLMLIIVSISFTFLSGVRTFIGNRWEIMVKIIAIPNQNDVTIP
jgi:hypothetical protein